MYFISVDDVLLILVDANGLFLPLQVVGFKNTKNYIL